MKVFLAEDLRIDDDEPVAAFVLAWDSEDAVRRLRQRGVFAPPKLIEYANDDAAVERLAGAKSIIDRLRRDGIYVIRGVALTGG